VLKALADEKINLTKIESRPIPGKFSEYRFLIEFESSPQTAAYRNAMKKLQSVTRMLAVIGNYPVIRV
jgi:chorismate mutase/prephenate dehydratase